jgi:hypothetical protein
VEGGVGIARCVEARWEIREIRERPPSPLVGAGVIDDGFHQGNSPSSFLPLPSRVRDACPACLLSAEKGGTTGNASQSRRVRLSPSWAAPYQGGPVRRSRTEMTRKVSEGERGAGRRAWIEGNGWGIFAPHRESGPLSSHFDSVLESLEAGNVPGPARQGRSLCHGRHTHARRRRATRTTIILCARHSHLLGLEELGPGRRERSRCHPHPSPFHESIETRRVWAAVRRADEGG